MMITTTKTTKITMPRRRRTKAKIKKKKSYIRETKNLLTEADTQVSIHVAASHKASQHQTLISQIQIVGPHAILA